MHICDVEPKISPRIVRAMLMSSCWFHPDCNYNLQMFRAEGSISIICSEFLLDINWPLFPVFYTHAHTVLCAKFYWLLLYFKHTHPHPAALFCKDAVCSLSRTLQGCEFLVSIHSLMDIPPKLTTAICINYANTCFCWVRWAVWDAFLCREDCMPIWEQALLTGS